jgi:8-oxo-dGTP diphosphatase
LLRRPDGFGTTLRPDLGNASVGKREPGVVETAAAAPHGAAAALFEGGVKREYPDRPVLAVGAVVVKDGKVLLAKRGAEPGRGLWSLPGGAVHPGEEMKAAIARELREECGIEVAVEEAAEVVERMIPDAEGRLRYHYVILDYRARWLQGDLSPSEEVEEARWVDPGDLHQYRMTRGTADVIRRLLARQHDGLKGLGG